MGRTYSTYVGPYVHCSVRTRPTTVEIKLCTKRGCRFAKQDNPMDKKNNFCPQCGAAAKVKEIKVKGEVDEVLDAYDITEATNERLVEICSAYPIKGVHLFVSNSTKAPGITLERGDAVGEIRRYDGIVIDQELMAFRDRHAKDLEIIYEHYGEDRVEVCWGLLAEVS